MQELFGLEYLMHYAPCSMPYARINGEMAERLMALVLKTSVGESPPGVQIPLSPPVVKTSNG